MQTAVLRRFCLITALFVFCLLITGASAETYKLTTGVSLDGEVLPSSATDAGVQIKVGDGQYEKVPWTSFSQEDLKKFAQNKKMDPFVEPFIEVSQQEKLQKTEVNIKQPPRINRPAPQSLLGALMSSGLGLFIVCFYAANIFAAYDFDFSRPIHL
jgi:hypothetical protein